MCEPQTKRLDAGTDDLPINVQMKILPAKVVVEGDPSHSYGIEEIPNVTLRSGVSTEIPMNGGTRSVTIFDASDPEGKKRVKVTIKAGQQEAVRFK
jgi:hypothetical protein